MILITFEGIDGSGKSSASREIMDTLRVAGFDCGWSREPTKYTDPAVEMRRLAKLGELTPEKELELFIKDRAEHIASLSHDIELVDRYYHSTMAYQGARGMDMAELEKLNIEEHGFPVPDLTLIFDVDVEVGLGRSEKSGEAIETHFEKAEFLEKVRENYHRIWENQDQFKGEIRFINAEVSMEGMMKDVWDIINSFLLSKAVEMDRAAESRYDVRKFYQKLLNIRGNRQNIDAWRYYLCFLITIADDTMFNEEWRELIYKVAPWVETEDLIADYPRLHVPVVMQLIQRARLKEATELVEGMYGDGEWRHRLESYINTLKHVKKHNTCVFPAYISYSDWFHGPHLIKFEWFPGKVEAVGDGKVYCVVGKTDEMNLDWYFNSDMAMECDDPWKHPQYGKVELTFKQWIDYLMASPNHHHKGRSGVPKPEVGMFFELYTFGDDDCRIELHQVPEDWPPKWMEPELPSDRYLKRWSEAEKENL